MATRIHRTRRVVTARIGAISLGMREPSMRRLQLTALGFNTTEYAVMVGLGVHAFDTGGAVAVGLATVARTVPALIAGPLLSVLIDRFARTTLLVIGLVARAALTGTVAVAIAADMPFAVILVILGLEAVAASTFYPSFGALIPELAETAETLTASTALGSAMESSGALLGPLIAAGLLVVGGPAWVFGSAAAVAAAATAAALTIRTDRRPSMTAARPPLLREFATGIRTISQDQPTRAVVSTWAMESVAVGLTEVLVVVVALDLVEWGDPGVGFLNAALGVGGLIGSLAMAAFTRSRPYGFYLAIGVTVFGVAIAANGIVVVGAIVVVAHVAIGHAGSQVDVAAHTLLQRTVPDDQLARVLGAFEGIYWGARAFGAVAASWAVVAFGTEAALVVLGVATTVAGLAALRPLRRIDEIVTVPAERLGLLGEIPLFAALAIPTLERLARSLEPADRPEGEIVIRQGDVDAGSLYVIEDGTVSVELDGRHVTTLGAGDMFGEIAPLNRTPRTATVRTTSPVRLYVLDAGSFVRAVSGRASSSRTASTMAGRRVAELDRSRDRRT